MSRVNNGPGPLNITFGSDMPITLLYLMLMSKIYVVNSDMKNVIGISDRNVMFKGPGSLSIHCNLNCMVLFCCLKRALFQKIAGLYTYFQMFSAARHLKMNWKDKKYVHK